MLSQPDRLSSMKLAQNKKKEEVSKKAPEGKEPEGGEGIKIPFLKALFKKIEGLHIPTHNSTLNQEMEKFYNMVMASEKATPKQMREQFLVVITTLNKVNATDQGALDRKNGKGKKEEKGGKKEKKKETKKKTKKKASGDLINGLIKLAYDNPDMRADILQVLYSVENSESVESKIIRYAYETLTVRLPLLYFLSGTLDKVEAGKIRTAFDVHSEMVTGVLHLAYSSENRQDFLPLIFDLLQKEQPFFIKKAEEKLLFPQVPAPGHLVGSPVKKKKKDTGKDLSKGMGESVKTLGGGIKGTLSGLKSKLKGGLQYLQDTVHSGGTSKDPEKATKEEIAESGKGLLEKAYSSVTGKGKEFLKKRKEEAPEREQKAKEQKAEKERKAREKVKAKHDLEIAKLEAKTRAEQKKLQESTSQDRGGQKVIVLRGEPPILPREFEEREPAKPQLSPEEMAKAFLEFYLKQIGATTKGEKKKGEKANLEKALKPLAKAFALLFEASENSNRIKEEGGGDTNFGVGDTRVEEDPDLFRYLDKQEGADSPAYPGESSLTPSKEKTPPDRYLFDFLEKYGKVKLKNPRTDFKVSYNTLLSNRTFQQAKDEEYEEIWPKANDDAWTWAMDEEKKRGFDLEEAKGEISKYKTEREADLKRLEQEGQMKNWPEKKMKSKIQDHKNKTNEEVALLSGKAQRIRDNKAAERSNKSCWLGIKQLVGLGKPPQNLKEKAQKAFEEAGFEGGISEAESTIGELLSSGASDEEIMKAMEREGSGKKKESISQEELDKGMAEFFRVARKKTSSEDLKCNPFSLPMRHLEDSSWLANSLVRIAHQNPDVRSEILSILVD